MLQTTILKHIFQNLMITKGMSFLLVTSWKNMCDPSPWEWAHNHGCFSLCCSSWEQLDLFVPLANCCLYPSILFVIGRDVSLSLREISSPNKLLPKLLISPSKRFFWGTKRNSGTYSHTSGSDGSDLVSVRIRFNIPINFINIDRSTNQPFT